MTTTLGIGNVGGEIFFALVSGLYKEGRVADRGGGALIGEQR